MNQGSKTEKINICSFDVDEETARHEPWTGGTIDYKANLDAFLKGDTFIYPSDSTKSYEYAKMCNQGGFVEKYKNTKFRETIGEYPIEVKSSFSSELDKGIRNNKNKRIIIYQVIAKD